MVDHSQDGRLRSDIQSSHTEDLTRFGIHLMNMVSRMECVMQSPKI